MNTKRRLRVRGRIAAAALALGLAMIPSAIKAAAYGTEATEPQAFEAREVAVSVPDEPSGISTAAVLAAASSLDAAADSAAQCAAQHAEELSWASTGSFIWPVDGPITSPFGRRHIKGGSSNHRGIDIGSRKGTEIAAADSGEIIWSGWDSSYGNFIKIRHDNGLVTCYAHMSERLVEVGARVRQGDIIGLVGSTGQSTGPHLHFEVRTESNERVDPVDYLPER